MRLMVGSAGLVVLAIIYLRWKRNINSGIAVAARWIARIARDPKTCGVAETFFVEAAVLWFVFPLLDTLYDNKNASPTLVHEAYAVSAFFFLCAVLLSHASKPERKQED